MSNLPTEIKINLDDIKPLIADCLDPGAVLLPAEAVQALWDFHGVRPADLETCGGIRASEKP